jgi:hypothetical protein
MGRRAGFHKEIIEMLENNADVTISLGGLALFCINKEKELEMAILQCPDHELLIDAYEITIDEVTGEHKRSRLIGPNPLDMERNIRIEVKNSKHQKIDRYINEQFEFDHERDLGDPKDFRWMVDLEGKMFGGRKLGRRHPISGADPKRLAPIITISDGVIYTRQRSTEKFAIISLEDDPGQSQLLGRIGFVVGLDISFKDRDGGEVLVSNENSRNSLPPLRNEPGKRYQIIIENLCELAGEPREGSDFRFFFDAVSHENGERFDLQRVVENGGRGDFTDTLARNREFSLDSGMQVCNISFLSQTKSILSLVG